MPHLRATFDNSLSSAAVYAPLFHSASSQIQRNMTSEAIIKQIEKSSEKTLNIHFKQRDTINGLFIKGNDYEELKSKNFWRIVTNARIEEWKRTKDASLARIFNGIAFTRISEGV